jgi:hypothetical protein
MAPLPKNILPSTKDLIDQFHEAQREMEKPRPYFQISSIGHECDRWLWLQFRWAVFEKFPGRILRLFRRGQAEEEMVIRDLINIGVDVRETGARQRTVYGPGHIQGHPDGIIMKNLPEATGSQHILEIKTHSLKSFNELVKLGSVEKAKPMHYAQMQVYMFLTGINRGLYYPVCKDNDETNPERVKLDPRFARKLVDRGHRISLMERLPEPISADPTWYKCRFCPGHDFCHVSHKIKEVNCRTCAHSTPKEDGTFHCAYWDSPIPDHAQVDGCDCHVIHPDLVPWPVDPDLSDDVTAVYVINGQKVRNGRDAYKSEELLNYDGPFNDPVVDQVREAFGGVLINA